MPSRKFLSHISIVVLLSACIVCFDRSPRVFSQSQSNDTEAIRALVGKIFELYQQKDLDKLVALWSEKSPFLAENKDILRKDLAISGKIAVKGYDVRKMQIESDKASLRIVAEMALTMAQMVKPVEKIEKKNRTIELVNEGGVWKIWKFIAPEVDLATAIMAAKTEEEWKTLMEREPGLVTVDLALALIRQNSVEAAYRNGYRHALAINQLAYKLAEQAGDRLVMANALISTGRIHGFVGTPEKSSELALDYYRRSLKIGEEFGLRDIMAKSLIESANVYFFESDLSHAYEDYERALKLSEQVGDLNMTVQAMNNLGVIHRMKGDYAKSLELQLKCLKMSESQLSSGADWTRLALAQTNVGDIFSFQDNYEQALAYYKRAYDSAEKGSMLGYVYARTVKADILSSMGDVYKNQGNHSLALECYQKSLNLVEGFGFSIAGYKETTISALNISIGDVLAAKNDLPGAIAKYQESLKLAEMKDSKSGASSALLSLSRMYLLREDYRETLAFAERAARVAEESGLRLNTYRALVTMAKAHRKLGNPGEARQALARAINFIEQLRDESAGSELDRQRSFQQDVTPYQAMIDLEVDQKRFTEAFSYAQRAKGRTLLELLQQGRVDIDKSVSTSEREQEQRLNRKIVSLNRQLTGERLKSEPDQKQLAEFEEQLKKARLEFEAFQTTLYASHPELKVQRGDVRPISFDGASGLIPDSKTALLDFIVTEENVQLFVLTRGTSGPVALNTYTIKIDRKSLAEKVDRFRRRLANKDFDFQKPSRELYGLLLKPAEGQLQNKTSLIISPDNVLWDLPFQVLQPHEGRYLIENAAISYAPSLSVLREMQLLRKRGQTPAAASILALGNPELGKQSIDLARLVLMNEELQPLPEAEKQVTALGQLYGKAHSKVYTGPAAREEIIKRESARYRILQLATHGILNDVSPIYSHVMLSQASGKSEEDGLLEAWEIMNLNLNADLVVLSACETARGRIGAGEGVIGLTWALFVAGCPTTVVSQWKVESSSTTALMVEFHKRFKTRFDTPQSTISTAEALRQASLELMKDKQYQHPFFWGGFVVVGDER